MSQIAMQISMLGTSTLYANCVVYWIQLCSQVCIISMLCIICVYIIWAYTLKHIMMTSSNGNIFRVSGHLCGNSPVSGEVPAQGQWRGAFMFSFIWARINGWVNTCEASDLRRIRPYYDVTVMYTYAYASTLDANCVVSRIQLFMSK